MQGAHLLLVEACAPQRRATAALLRAQGYRVTDVADGEGFLRQLSQAHHDAVLLDLNLPDEDGLVLLRRLRARGNMPVFVLSGRQDEQSRLAALELGADDYLSKPFLARELVLRLGNFFSRQWRPAGRMGDAVTVGPWRLYSGERTLRDGEGHSVALTAGESDILTALANAAGRTVSREQLADALSGSIEGSSPETVTVLIYRLRKKLALLAGDSASGRASVIITVPGLGYRVDKACEPDRRAAPAMGQAALPVRLASVG